MSKLETKRKANDEALKSKRHKTNPAEVYESDSQLLNDDEAYESDPPLFENSDEFMKNYDKTFRVDNFVEDTAFKRIRYSENDKDCAIPDLEKFYVQLLYFYRTKLDIYNEVKNCLPKKKEDSHYLWLSKIHGPPMTGVEIHASRIRRKLAEIRK